MDSSRHGDNPGGEPTPHNVLREIHSSRRSPRRLASFPVWLRNEKPSSIWEEETETQVVSRYGACLRCRHLIQPDAIVVILRRGNGKRAQARVKYCRYNSDGFREVGIEFVGKDNFWDLNWNPSTTVEQTEELTEDSALQDVFGTSEISADDKTGIGQRATGYRLQNGKPEVSPAVVDMARAFPSADEISSRAYEIYLARGGVSGEGVEDWLQAERELKEQYCEV
jgi:Protein of unknown function (DUF2934)